MRSLYGSPEGERCLVPESGSLDGVEVALWNNGIMTRPYQAGSSLAWDFVIVVRRELPRCRLARPTVGPE